MKRALTYFLSIAAGTLLLAGCQKTGILSNAEGDLVRFSASAGPAGTKTAYSNEFTSVDGSTIERINWQVGDQIRIWSDYAEDRYHAGKHYSDYKIWGTITNSGMTSSAGIVNAGNYTPENPDYDPGVPNPGDIKNDNVNGLVWGEANSYNFWGVYPVSEGSLSTDLKDLTIEGKIDSDQKTGDLAVNMPKYGYMTAMTEKPVNKGENVTLKFEPAFTAFEVTLKAEAGAGNITVTKFELVSVAEDGETAQAMAGSFKVKYEGTTRTFDFSDAKENSVSIDLDNAVITPDSNLKFTVFALPQDFSKLKLKFTILDEENKPATRSLKLKKNGSWVSFPGCKKYRITGVAMPKDVWKFTLDLGLTVEDWIVKDVPEIDYTDAIVVATPFVFENEGNVDVKIDGEKWDIFFNKPASSVLYVKFTIASPQGAQWNVQMVDPDGYFTLKSIVDSQEVDPHGTIAEGGSNITLKITPNASRIPANRDSDYNMILHTYVEVGDIIHNADSETQNFDHYHKYAEFIIPANN